MRVVHGIDQLEPSMGRAFVVIGVFDGLHRGHEYLLAELRRAARAQAARPMVITFDHHPDEVITGVAPPLLCDPAERLDRLAEAGVEVTVVQTFDVALRMTPFDEFVRRIAARVELAGFLMTPESAFGHDRGGTPETVADLGEQLGYRVVVVPPLLIDGRPVSSGETRRAISEGRLADAERLLGRSYAVVGDRSSAAGSASTGSPERGVELRFPMPVALPPLGDYAARVTAARASGSRAAFAATASVRVGDDGSLGLPNVASAAPRLRVEFIGPLNKTERGIYAE